MTPNLTSFPEFQALSPELQRLALAVDQHAANYELTRRQIAREADRVLATYAETAQHPECQAIFNSLSPDGQRVAGRLVEMLDKYGADAVEQTLDHVLNGCSDDPRVTMIDDGSRSGIRLERYDRPGDEPRSWLSFSVGQAPHKDDYPLTEVSIDICGGNAGIELLIAGHDITPRAADYWTLHDLRQLHTAIGCLLTDDRLLGALAEQAA
jgi:hypothetical protein